MIKNSRFLILYLLIIAAGIFIHLHSNITVPLNKSFREFPRHNKGWEMRGETVFDLSVLEVLRPTDYLMRSYANSDGTPVSLYIGYHDGGKDSGPIHSPKNCLPGSGWYKLSEKNILVNPGGEDINVVNAVYENGDQKEMFFYWFKVKGGTLTNEYALKYAEIRNSILYRRKDASFIRVSIPFDSDEKNALSAGIKFINDFFPVMKDFLPD